MENIDSLLLKINNLINKYTKNEIINIIPPPEGVGIKCESLFLGVDVMYFLSKGNILLRSIKLNKVNKMKDRNLKISAIVLVNSLEI
tara:strand:- start:2262 stop:2522 length:261 start_codon:yes stop_codon:yes gene_type:complete